MIDNTERKLLNFEKDLTSLVNEFYKDSIKFEYKSEIEEYKFETVRLRLRESLDLLRIIAQKRGWITWYTDEDNKS